MSGSSKLPYAGVIDADGHILEPPDLWERYIDPAFRDRAVHLRPNADGLEVLEFDGRPSKIMAPGSLSFMGGMGKPKVARNTSTRGSYTS